MQLHALTLDRFHTAKSLNQMALHPRVGLGLIAQLLANQWRAEQGHPHEKWHHSQSPEGELNRVEKHHGDVDHREHSIKNHRERRTGQEAADLLKLIDAATDLSNRPISEVTERQPQEVINNCRAQGDIDAVRRVRKQIGAQRGQHSLSQGHAHQQGAKHIEGADVALADYSIDDLLNQQRIQQGKQLHKEARHQHLHQHGLVLLQSRQEPGQAEALLGGASAALDTQHIEQVVVIPTWQGSGRHQSLAGHRITQHQLTALINLPDHHRSTRAQSQRRQGQASELYFIDLHG